MTGLGLRSSKLGRGRAIHLFLEEYSLGQWSPNCGSGPTSVLPANFRCVAKHLEQPY